MNKQNTVKEINTYYGRQGTIIVIHLCLLHLQTCHIPYHYGIPDWDTPSFHSILIVCYATHINYIINSNCPPAFKLRKWLIRIMQLCMTLYYIL